MTQRVLSPDEARVKVAVRKASSLLGGIDGTAATVSRGRSTVGRWISLNEPDLPTLDCALAMDSALVAMGQRPLIATAMAQALSASLVLARGGTSGVSDLLAAHAGIVRQGGDVQVAVAEALADGRIDKAERNKIRNEISEAVDALHELDVLVQGAAA